MITTIQRHLVDLRQEIDILDQALADLAQHKVPSEVGSAEMLCRIDNAKRSLHLGYERLAKTAGPAPKPSAN